MERTTVLDHQHVVAYLRNEHKGEENQYLAALRKDNPTYRVFFELIDDWQRDLPAAKQQHDLRRIDCSFQAIDELLAGAFYGDLRQSHKQALIDGLISSPLFFHRLLSRLEPIAPLAAGLSLPPVAFADNASMLSDEELLAGLPPPRRKKKYDLTSQWHKIEQAVLLPAVASVRATGWSLLLQPATTLATVALLVISFAWIAERNWLGADLNQYKYDQVVPYPFGEGAVRGVRSSTSSDSLYRAFDNGFLTAMSMYQRHDYAQTIQWLSQQNTAIPLLEQHLEVEKNLARIRDFYFYQGVSYLAMGRSRLLAGEQERQARLFDSAAHNLELASHFTSEHNLESPDREAFFLSLAYGFSGDKTAAREQLLLLPKTSAYYPRSRALLKLWQR